MSLGFGFELISSGGDVLEDFLQLGGTILCRISKTEAQGTEESWLAKDLLAYPSILLDTVLNCHAKPPEEYSDETKIINITTCRGLLR